MGNESYYYGGGVQCYTPSTTPPTPPSSPALEDCILRDNYAHAGGWGGGVFVEGPSAPRILGCTFSGNTATGCGGALGCDYGAGNPDIDECIFVDNHADGPGDGGGAIACGSTSNATIGKCTFYQNSSETGAGLLVMENARATVERSIFAFGIGESEEVVCLDNGVAALSCCDVYGNLGGDWVGSLADRWGIDGNFWGDPGFCDAPNGDFTIQASSPCAPDDLIGCGLVGADTVGCSGEVFVVAPDGDGDFPTIQAALDGCADWDVIELLDGDFTGDGNRDVDFLGKSVTVRSQSGDPSACRMFGQDLPPGYHFGFRFQDGEGQEAMVRAIGLSGFHALTTGGAIRCPDGSPRFAGCLITGNSANEGGGAVCCSSGSMPQLVRCTLSGNHAPLGAGIYADASSRLAMQACIVSFSPEGEAVYCAATGEPVLSCCDVYGNAGGDWVGCIEDQRDLRGNLCVDPCFCDREAGDYRLWNYSRCVSGACGQVGALGIGCYDWSGVARNEDARMSVSGAHPNPFRDATSVAFTVTGGCCDVLIQVHDVGGGLVRSLVNGPRCAGGHIAFWDGRDSKGRSVPAGVYFCRVRTPGRTAVRPILRVR